MSYKSGLLAACLLTGVFGGRAWFAPPEAPADASSKLRVMRANAARGPAVHASGKFAAAMALRGGFQRSVALAEAAAGGSSEDCRRWLESCAPEDESALRAAAARWAEADPFGFFQYLTGEGRKFLASGYVVSRELFHAWTASDPDAATAAVEKVENQLTRYRLLTDLIGSMLTRDPDRAMKLAAGLENIPWVGLPSMYSDWVEGRYAQAAEMILAMPRSNFRMDNSLNLASRWGATDPAAALDFAFKLGPLYFVKASGYALGRWLDQDPNGAREYIATTALPSARAQLGPAAAGSLAKESPLQALEWVEANLSGRARVEALAAVVRSGAKQSPLEASAVAESLPDGPVKNNALRDAAQAWFSKDMDSAGAWAATLPPGYRNAALEGIERATLTKEQKARARALLAPGDGTQ